MTFNFYTSYTAEQMNDWPVDSYNGRERDLADYLSDDTLDAIDTALETDEFAAYTIFILMMMNKAAAQAMVDIDEAEEDLQDLIQGCQDDARDDSSEVFQARVAQRLAIRNTIRNFATTHFTTITKED